MSMHSCSTVKYVPVEKEVVKTEIVRDTVTVVKIEKEYVETEVPVKDTVSVIETSVAVSKAEIKGNVLNHSLRNKDTLRVEYRYVTKVEKEYVDRPIEVTVEKKVIPKWCWILLVANMLCVGVIAGKTIAKFLR